MFFSPDIRPFVFVCGGVARDCAFAYSGLSIPERLPSETGTLSHGLGIDVSLTCAFGGGGGGGLFGGLLDGGGGGGCSKVCCFLEHIFGF